MIPSFFYLLFFITPLIFFHQTSELFEFNKIIVLYTFTACLLATWVIKMIRSKKFIFKKTTLDIPLSLFLGTQGISTLLSIDFHTSLFGYYSRFHGGLLSSICYAVLYWAWVSNMDSRTTKKSIYSLLFSAFFVSLYGIAQHFGIDKDIWTQDVQNRVFSTLGQPNWLAAWLVALLPLTWLHCCHPREAGDLIKNTNSNYIQRFTVNWIPAFAGMTKIMYLLLTTLLFITLLFTKSRSGLLAFAIAFIIFWLFVIVNKCNSHKENIKMFIVHCSLFIVTFLVLGTPWTPSIAESFRPNYELQTTNYKTTTTSLETGGTESGEIRKIVWKGAFDIWKNYPIFGTGVETFAFAYYQFKPNEHNYTSEWDYLYNKAHNEYLNYLATTGIIGFSAYLILIVAIFYQFKRYISEREITTRNAKNQVIARSKGDTAISKNKTTHPNFALCTLNFALLAGYISILITNFFGFSVVPVALLFFLLPAFSVSITTNHEPQSTIYKNLSTSQLFAILFVLCSLFFVLFAIGKYWYSDFLYAKGRLLHDSGDYTKAEETLNEAIKLSKNEVVYWDEVSQNEAEIAILLAENNQSDLAKKFAIQAVNSGKQALELAPDNVNMKRNFASVLTKLSIIDQSYLILANATLKEAKPLAPTDPKLSYALSASYYRVGDLENAIVEMNKGVAMKNDYKDARYALALMYLDANNKEEAKKHLQYILENIDPNDERVKKDLEEIN